jgi:spore germination protein KC
LQPIKEVIRLKMVSKNLIFVLMFLLVILLFNGCSGSQELNGISLVTAIGIDVGTNNEIKVTVLANIPSMSLANVNATSKSDMWIGTATGKSLFEAMNNLNKTSSRHLVWYNNRVIIIGSEAAKKVLPEVADLSTRSRNFRFSTKMIITDGTASDMLSIPSDVQVDLSAEIDGLIDNSTEWSNSYIPSVKDFLIDMYSDKKDGILGKISYNMTSNNTYSPNRQGMKASYWLDKEFGSAFMEGSTIIKQGAFVGFLDGEQTKACLLILNKAHNCQYTLLPDGNKIVMRLSKEKAAIVPIMIGNKINININLNIEGTISETTEKVDMMNKDEITKIQSLFEAELKKEMISTVNKLQKNYKSDALEFGSYIRIKYPTQWKQMEPYWNSIYPNMQINYNVKVIISRFGKSYELNQ